MASAPVKKSLYEFNIRGTCGHTARTIDAHTSSSASVRRRDLSRGQPLLYPPRFGSRPGGFSDESRPPDDIPGTTIHLPGTTDHLLGPGGGRRGTPARAVDPACPHSATRCPFSSTDPFRITAGQLPGPCGRARSPTTTDASGQYPSPQVYEPCACYYPRGFCPFPQGDCAFPRGNCIAPCGDCGSPQPSSQWPSGSPQVGSSQSGSSRFVRRRIRLGHIGARNLGMMIWLVDRRSTRISQSHGRSALPCPPYRARRSRDHQSPDRDPVPRLSFGPAF